MFAFLLIVSLVSGSPVLIVPMKDAHSCDVNRLIMKRLLPDEGSSVAVAQCYDLSTQGWHYENQ